MPSAKKTDKLADLTASLAARKAVAAPIIAEDRSPEPDNGAGLTVSHKLEELIRPNSLVPNQSVSLYESDLDALEKVRHWLSARGLRGCNSSEAIRLCIRLAAVESNGDKLAAICTDARASDGRKTRWAKGKSTAHL